MEGISTLDMWYAIEATKKDAGNESAAAVLVPEATPEPYPNGFFKSAFKGRAFYCHDCHLLYVANAPATVRHCKRLDVDQPQPLSEASRVTLLQRFLKLFR